MKLLKVLLKLETLFALVICSVNVYAWDEKQTHRDLSATATYNSNLGTTDFLKKLGLNQGLLELLKFKAKEQELYKWILEGSTLEDEGTIWETVNNKSRSNNHFHNPLKPWASAGLNDVITTPGLLPPFTTSDYPVYGEAALLWAQDGARQSTFRQGAETDWDWSWQTVRLYFYKALTAQTDAEKQEYFARTFRGAGHQLHLLQDMSVPAHVRNDSHARDTILGYVGISLFESWAAKEYLKIRTFANQYAANSSLYKPQVALDTSKLNLAPTTQFYDTDLYTGAAPSTDLTWGLSEYTNSNFVSDDTIFTENFSQGDRHYFPYPRYNLACYTMKDVQLGTDLEGNIITKKYLQKNCEGEPVDNFLVAAPLFKLLAFSPTLQRSMLSIDQLVYESYAEKLIPRAVGYSAALLDYFFRGELEIKQAIPVFKDNIIEKLTLKVRNYTSTKEALSNGYFSLSYQYTVDGLTVYGNIPYAIGMASIGTPSLPYGKKDDGSDNDVADLVVTFDQFPNSIKITEYPSVKFTLTYFGDLGAEMRDKTGDTENTVMIGGAVIGKVFKGGKILFNEEWDNGLTGNHPWFHSKWDCDTCWYPNIPPSNRGTIDNTVSSGYLQKNDSIYEWPFDGAHSGYISQGNATYLRASEPEYNDVLPLTITKDTYLLHKIDDISINQPLDGNYQILFLEFNNGYRIELSSLAVPYTGSNKLLFTFPLGKSVAANIHEMFKAYGVPVTDDLQLVWIEFMQFMTYNSVPPVHIQSMKIDHIRVIDAKPVPLDAP